MQDVVWICTYFRIRQSAGDKIVEQVCAWVYLHTYWRAGRVLKIYNFKIQTMQHTIEKVNEEENLVFLDINVIMSNRKEFTCHCYHKQTYSGKQRIFSVVHHLSIKTWFKDGSRGLVRNNHLVPPIRCLERTKCAGLEKGFQLNGLQ